MDGVLAIWKPAGWTSHDVVAKARRLLRTKRIGHAGTLDPEVTGVLPLCIGRATRVVEYLQELPKSYVARLKFGIATDTEDMTGNIIEQMHDVTASLQPSRIEQTLLSFVGSIEQTPPMYSAVKHNGKRLYELAREGQVVERKKRTAVISNIEVLDMQLDLAQPELAFSVTCSKGTYIRTLCVDIGKALQVPAVMAELVRTSSAGLTRKDCLTLEQVEELQQSTGISAWLKPADQVITHIAARTVGEEAAKRVLVGQKLALKYITPRPQDELLCRLYSEVGTFLGIFQADLSLELLKPIKVFSPVNE